MTENTTSENTTGQPPEQAGGPTPQGMLIDVENLTPPQIKALQAMQYGMNFNQVAHSAGVSRQTLHQWRRHDAAFRAAVVTMQEATLSNVQNRMIAMTEDALHAVGDAITSGNPWIAMDMLRAMRCFPARSEQGKSEVTPKGSS